MLYAHILIALVSTLYGGQTLWAVFTRQKMDAKRSALRLALLLVLSVTSGLLLAIQTGTGVLSVCDNLILYITGFSVVFASLTYTKGRLAVAPHMTWSYAYATALPVALIAFGF